MAWYLHRKEQKLKEFEMLETAMKKDGKIQAAAYTAYMMVLLARLEL